MKSFYVFLLFIFPLTCLASQENINNILSSRVGKCTEAKVIYEKLQDITISDRSANYLYDLYVIHGTLSSGSLIELELTQRHICSYGRGGGGCAMTYECRIKKINI